MIKLRKPHLRLRCVALFHPRDLMWRVDRIDPAHPPVGLTMTLEDISEGRCTPYSDTSGGVIHLAKYICGHSMVEYVP